MTYAADSVLAGLDPEQREAALVVRGPVCILAGAGTGKTRAITHRIAYAVRSGTRPAGQLLAVTFTARAAGELRSRLAGSALTACRLARSTPRHCDSLRICAPGARRGDARGRRQPTPARWRGRVAVGAVEPTAPSCGISPPRSSGPRRFSWRTPEDYPARAMSAGREPPTTAATVAAVYAEYEAAKGRVGRLDFADLLLIMAGAIEEYADVAEEIRSRYRHFVVDEYQDVRPLQQRLLEAWLGGRDDVCVVGDPNQTIYSFAGATPEHLLRFADRYPGAARRPARSGLPVDATGGGTGEPARRCGRRGARWRPDRGFDCGPAPERSAADLRRVRRRAGRGRRRRGALPRADRRRNAGVRGRGVVPHQRPVRGLRAGVGGGPGAIRLAGGERFFDRPEIREARLLLPGRCAAEADEATLCPTGARRPRRRRLASSTDPPPAAPPGNAGNPWRRS